jgi:hypothetical protein
VSSVDEVEHWVAQLDPTVPYPEDAHRMVRGHTHGPRSVRLPHNFLDTRGGTALGREAEEAVSGG